MSRGRSDRDQEDGWGVNEPEIIVGPSNATPALTRDQVKELVGSMISQYERMVALAQVIYLSPAEYDEWKRLGMIPPEDIEP